MREMRKIVAAASMSLDGVMQAPGGAEEDPSGGFQLGGWTFRYWDDAIADALGDLFSHPCELLLGRKTYEIFASHWPYVQDDPFADAINNATKYVATSSRAPLTWQNSVAIRDVRQLQREGPRHGHQQSRRNEHEHDADEREQRRALPQQTVQRQHEEQRPARQRRNRHPLRALRHARRIAKGGFSPRASCAHALELCG
jgi:dihydrofolate reductase